jgi:large subunit ribosomal protein L10
VAISRERKEELVALYGELLQKSDAIFLAEYGGMSVKIMEDLRIEVDKANGAFHVTKNTLLRHILEEADIDVPADALQGQLATGFALAEAPALAKAMVDFASKQENMKIRGGFLGTRYLTAADVEALAKLPSLDQLRAQLLGLMRWLVGYARS